MIKDLLEQGLKKQIDKATEHEKTKVGTLRAGNTGMVTPDGEIIGSCAAATYLRMIGVNGKRPDINKELMFAGGRLNEDHWLSVLEESYDGPILCEEDIATCWETAGVKVTGRPDIVLCSGTKDEPVPACMVELKQVMSINSAYNVLVKREPQLKHLMQAAHYCWQLGCDGELWYTNRNNLDMPGWMEFREFPPPSPELPIGYRYYRFGDINPKTNKPRKHQITESEYLSGEFNRTFYQAGKITPFTAGFKLKLDDTGRLFYQDTRDFREPWVETIVNIPDIVRFYDYVANLEMESGKVPPPALNLTATGDKIGWKFYQYSDLGQLDPHYQQGRPLSEWTEAVKDFFKNADK